MKTHLKELIKTALTQVASEINLETNSLPEIQIQYTKDSQHGDFACNIAMQLAKQAKKNPRMLADQIIAKLPSSEQVLRVETAGPGFINFYMTEESFHPTITNILKLENAYGQDTIGKGKRVHMEIVSANPTGPLHVGHGRLAAFDGSLSNILKTLGYDVHCEYYVNDAGRQMYILALSIWLRYLQALDVNLPFSFPEQAYQGSYVIDIAKELQETNQDAFLISEEVLSGWALSDLTNPDRILDDLIDHMRNNLSEEHFTLIFETGLNSVLGSIKEDLADFKVDIDEWFMENRLWKQKEIEKSISVLKENGFIYEKEGATWFEATRFGDEKDRVVIRNNGQYTYFAADIAYHWDKFNRGFDIILDTFGSDHHGYTQRIHGVASALGKNPDAILCFLIQFAILYRSGEKVSMSTRKGVFVSLRELYEEVGVDAARFFYVMRRHDQHLDFDLELAKSKSNENPVYYIQYAHARICSIARQLDEKNIAWSKEASDSLSALNTDAEKALLRCLWRYQDTLKLAAKNFEPQVLANYLHELANYFHSYYNAYQFIVDDEPLRNARLSLVFATRYVIANGLKILGVSAPNTM